MKTEMNENDREKYLSEKKERLLKELNGSMNHDLPTEEESGNWKLSGLYDHSDLLLLQNAQITSNPVLSLASLDELLERDRLREKDGFPRKIKVGRLIKPGKIDKGCHNRSQYSRGEIHS